MSSLDIGRKPVLIVFLRCSRHGWLKRLSGLGRFDDEERLIPEIGGSLLLLLVLGHYILQFAVETKFLNHMYMSKTRYSECPSLDPNPRVR